MEKRGICQKQKINKGKFETENFSSFILYYTSDLESYAYIFLWKKISCITNQPLAITQHPS